MLLKINLELYQNHVEFNLINTEGIDCTLLAFVSLLELSRLASNWKRRKESKLAS